MTTNAHEIADKSVCLVLNCERLGNSASVDTDDIEAKGADKDMLRVSKALLRSKELKAVKMHDFKTSRWVKRIAFPSPLFKRGAHLIPKIQVAEVQEVLEKAVEERNKKVAAFVAAYPAQVKQAKKDLGPLFDATEYPPVETIAGEFEMSWAWVEWGTPTSLKAISAALYEKERAKAETEWAAATTQIRDALRQSMVELVNGFVDKLGDTKKIRKTTLKQLEDFWTAFEKRDLTNDADTQALIKKARKLTAGVDAKQIRTDENLAGALTKGFAEIQKSLGKMTEEKPTRARARKDEEV